MAESHKLPLEAALNLLRQTGKRVQAGPHVIPLAFRSVLG